MENFEVLVFSRMYDLHLRMACKMVTAIGTLNAALSLTTMTLLVIRLILRNVVGL